MWKLSPGLPCSTYHTMDGKRIVTVSNTASYYEVRKSWAYMTVYSRAFRIWRLGTIGPSLLDEWWMARSSPTQRNIVDARMSLENDARVMRSCSGTAWSICVGHGALGVEIVSEGR